MICETQGLRELYGTQNNYYLTRRLVTSPATNKYSPFNTFNTIMGKAIEITDANFDEIIASDQPVMIDFWAEWCGPCKMIGPIVEELAGEFEGKAVIGKLDVQENSQIPARFGVRNIPTLLFFKNGQLVDKQVGVVPKAILSQKISATMEAAVK